jgi:hypothetical protein
VSAPVSVFDTLALEADALLVLLLLPWAGFASAILPLRRRLRR